MRLFRPWIPAPAPATAATARRIASSANLGRNALRGPDFVWSDFYLTKWFPLTEHVKLRIDVQFFNRIQPSEFRASEHGAGRHSRQAFHANRVRRADLHDFSANRAAGRRFGRRQLAAHDRVSIPPGVLKLQLLVNPDKSTEGFSFRN